MEINCIELDSVSFFVIKSNKNVVKDVFIEASKKWWEIREPDTIFISDSILLYTNLSEILNLNQDYIIYPYELVKLKNLQVINNETGFCDGPTFAKVPPLDSLNSLYLGMVSSKIDKVPRILFSKNLLVVEVSYAGTNEAFFIEIIKACYEHNHIQELNIYEAASIKFPKSFRNQLSFYQKEFSKRKKKLNF